MQSFSPEHVNGRASCNKRRLIQTPCPAMTRKARRPMQTSNRSATTPRPSTPAEAPRARAAVGALLAIDEKRRAAILASEQAQARRNAASKEIGDAKKAKDEARASKLMAEVAELKTKMPELQAARKDAHDELEKGLARLPNPAARRGARRRRRARQRAASRLRQEARLGLQAETARRSRRRAHDMDFERRKDPARARVLKKGLARLKGASGSSCSTCTPAEHGYTEINPPLLRNDVMFGTGNCRSSRTTSSGRSRGDGLVAAERACRRQRLGHPDRRSLTTNLVRESILDEKRTADAADRADAVLSRRSRCRRAAIPAA